MEVAAWGLLVIGALIVLSILSKAVLESLALPDLLGYLLLGVGLGLIDQAWPQALPAGPPCWLFWDQSGWSGCPSRFGGFFLLEQRMPSP